MHLIFMRELAEQVTNHLGQHDSQHHPWGGLDIICELYLKKKRNKGLCRFVFWFFFIYLEMKAMAAQDNLPLSQGNGKQLSPLKGEGSLLLSQV